MQWYMQIAEAETPSMFLVDYVHLFCLELHELFKSSDKTLGFNWPCVFFLKQWLANLQTLFCICLFKDIIAVEFSFFSIKQIRTHILQIDSFMLLHFKDINECFQICIEG